MAAYIEAFLKRDKVRKSRDYALIQKKCYFCDSPELLRYHEHYYFCPGCTVLYTYLLIHDTECKHISVYAHIPTTIRTPWFDGYAHTKPGGLNLHIWQGYDDELYYCSVCHAMVNCDGW